VNESLSARARAILDAVEPSPSDDVDRLLRLAHDTILLAAETHRRGEALAASLHDVTARLEAAVRALTAAPPAEAAPAKAPEGGADVAAVRLVAIEQAVAGANRGEVGRRLREEMGIDDPSAVLDDLFGRGTGPTARLTWGLPDAPAA
jgi:hypothetical protein